MRIVSILLTLLAVFNLVSIVQMTAAWMRGELPSIALPSLGLIVSGELVLVLLVLVEIALVLLAAWSAR